MEGHNYNVQESQYEDVLLMERYAGLMVPAFLLFGIFQIVLGFMGLEHFAGIWGVIGGVAAITFRFMLPLTIGTFMGAYGVFDWPIWVAALVTLPGLLFLVPALLADIVDYVRLRR
ncbi:MAG: hypothetical protein ABF254_14305 [Octadecabacter sp.]